MTQKWTGAIVALPIALYLLGGCAAPPQGASVGTISRDPLIAAPSMKLVNLNVMGMT
jgi:hypothetical protein